MKKYTVVLLATLWIVLVSQTAYAEVPPKYGAGLTVGNSYDPDSDITWLQGYFVAVYDYDSIWPHSAPDPLRFKMEGHAGLTVQGEARAIVSANVLATYYLDGMANSIWHPYVEAGIGVIYTDFQVEEQGLRINFNPQFGIGADFTTSGGLNWFGNLRAHHVSNGGLDDDNRGINSVALTIGFYL